MPTGNDPVSDTWADCVAEMPVLVTTHPDVKSPLSQCAEERGWG
jgi:hypothetical protein